MSHPLEVAATGDREITITREFDAPRHLVFEAHTRPELLKRWLTGPEGWELAVCEIDLRAGGSYRYVWKRASPDAQDIGVEECGVGGTYQEIDAPALIRHTELFDQDWTGGETQCRVTFEDLGGRTLLTTTVLYSSVEARDGALGAGMEDGLVPGYARLDDLLAETSVHEGA